MKISLKVKAHFFNKIKEESLMVNLQSSKLYSVEYYRRKVMILRKTLLLVYLNTTLLLKEKNRSFIDHLKIQIIKSLSQFLLNNGIVSKA